MSADLNLNLSGQGVTGGQSGPHGVHGPAPIAPVSSSGDNETDSVAAATGKGGKKGTQASSPELMEALYIMWIGGSGNNQMSLQSYGTNGGVEGASGKTINSGLFKLEMQNQYNAIAISVLNNWGKSIHEQGKMELEHEKAQRISGVLAAQGKEGYEAYFDSLSPEQKYKELMSNKIEGFNRIDRGIAEGLGTYLERIKTGSDPGAVAQLPFMTSMIMLSGSLKTDFASVDPTSSKNITLNNIKDGPYQVLDRVLPTYSVDLGYMGALYANASVFLALGRTVPSGAAPAAKEPMINYEFAKNYAQQILSVVNGSEFNSMAMAMISARMEGGNELSDHRKAQLAQIVKTTLLSTALALLYKMESSYKGRGGGMTGKEFSDLIDGNMILPEGDLKGEMAGQVRSLLSGLPANEGSRLKAALIAYVDSQPSAHDFTDIGKVFSHLRPEDSKANAMA